MKEKADTPTNTATEEKEQKQQKEMNIETTINKNSTLSIGLIITLFSLILGGIVRGETRATALEKDLEHMQIEVTELRKTNKDFPPGEIILRLENIEDKLDQFIESKK